MKSKLINKILVSLIFISSIVTTGVIIYKTVENNNTEISYENNNQEFTQIEIPKEEMYKVVDMTNNSWYFKLNNLEYYLITKMYQMYPELVGKKLSFEADDMVFPKEVKLIISINKDIIWNYSII